ncbi:MAG: tRNA (guanosine(37)-N1)-methyltransferase TrmD, partial [Candidatus Omnitrophota bacterium]|nr:tRNA (guanosine(37)-N1)-methyltransferase TrmD [Candidatus Omnitrophota bacterium]
FDIITIFPNIFNSYLNESIIKRARKNKKIKINAINLRDFTNDKSRLHSNRGSSTKWSGHKTVDEKPYGGGPGMVFKIEPLVKALDTAIKNKGRKKEGLKKTLIILFSASGKQFNSKIAADFAKKYNHIVMVAGHYEGVDERIKKVIENWKLKIENLSIGPYVLTGGELPAMVVIDAVSRHIPGVLGKYESLEEKRYGVGVPMYTRPETFIWKGKKFAVPKILLSGNHKKIENWRKQHQK